MKNIPKRLLKCALLVSGSLIIFTSCSPFSKLSMHSDLGNDGIYTTVSNDVLGFTTQPYGDFEFAFSRKELRKI